MERERYRRRRYGLVRERVEEVVVDEDQVAITGLHRGQLEVARSSARYLVLACGRRWGKTVLASALAWYAALRGGRVWWVAPTYPLTRVGWRLLREYARPLVACGRVVVREGERLIEVVGGGWLQVRSGHDPSGLVSEGLDFVVVDEAALMVREAWEVGLRPSLVDRRGRAVFISTPRGRNWFWELYRRGVVGEDGEWASWSFATWENPYIEREEIERARRELPERVFRQEFGAEFIEDSGAVFRNVMGCVDEEVAEGSEGPYVFGVDWGRVDDYTVVAVVDVRKRACVRLARWGGAEYALQLERLRGLYRQYRPVVMVVEANAMGGPLVEQLAREGMPVHAFWTSVGTKARVIEGLVMAFERSEIVIPDDRVLQGELMAFEMERLGSGVYRYGAPSGVHDDCVMALALAWSAVGSGEGVRVAAGGNPYRRRERMEDVELEQVGGQLRFTRRWLRARRALRPLRFR